MISQCAVMSDKHHEIAQRYSHSEDKVKTTGVAGGLHRPYKGLGQPRLKALERFANRISITGCPLPGAAFLLALAYWLTRKRVGKLFETDLVRGYVFL